MCSVRSFVFARVFMMSSKIVLMVTWLFGIVIDTLPKNFGRYFNLLK